MVSGVVVGMWAGKSESGEQGHSFNAKFEGLRAELGLLGLVTTWDFPQQIGHSVDYVFFGRGLVLLGAADIAEGVRKDACSKQIQHDNHVTDGLTGLKKEQNKVHAHQSPEAINLFFAVQARTCDAIEDVQACRPVDVRIRVYLGFLFRLIEVLVRRR